MKDIEKYKDLLKSFGISYSKIERDSSTTIESRSIQGDFVSIVFDKEGNKVKGFNTIKI